uniref:Reverse transcriptase domain-containing protein n=1 Tax=Nicotiana tabacum TaxID=4097 RepID=A0A1S3X213_TOBAC|nr:PREDICTED: uncharacterized protein LOC107760411 [Nicotiana tabacum]
MGRAAEVVNFANCIEEGGLIELPYQGSRYTLSDKYEHRILSKIDWTFINGAWLDVLPSSKTIFLLEGISDHCPTKVIMAEDRSNHVKSFIYCNNLNQHPHFTRLIEEGWLVQVKGYKMFQIVKKLKLLKMKLKKLNKDHSSNIVAEAKEDRKSLHQARVLLHTRPLDIELQAIEKEKYLKFKTSSYLAEVYLQQKSKATWLQLGDDNTSYFHSIIKHGKLKQAIIHIKNDQGGLNTNQDSIAREFTEEEVKETMFSIGKNKSPVPDEYGSGLYKATWSIVGKDVIEVVLEFFHNGKMIRQINATNIALIPKSDHPKSASQYRPIACCNVLYKCISKILCRRLKEAMSHIVTDNQSTFVQGRSMIHNILICHDLLRHYNRKTSPRCLMKIDLRKAYDMVSWEFLEEALRGYGFPEKFIRLVMTCVSTPKFTIKINGESQGYFDGQRGLRQADHVPHLLFVFVMEYLTRVLNCMSLLPDKYHPMCKSLKLTRLIFANDLMVFCKGDEDSVNKALEALNHFSVATRLIANMDKSHMFVADVPDQVKAQLLDKIGFAKRTFPIRYLGLPLSYKKWSKLECQQLINKITSRITTTYVRQLSYAGGLHVLNVVLKKSKKMAVNDVTITHNVDAHENVPQHEDSISDTCNEGEKQLRSMAGNIPDMCGKQLLMMPRTSMLRK